MPGVKRLAWDILTLIVLAGLMSAGPACADTQIQASMPQPAKSPEPGSSPITGDYWALIIGVDTYRHAPPLAQAVSSAQRARDELAQRHGIRRERIIELYNDQATLRNIEYALFRIASEARAEDGVLVFFAGHTQYDEHGRLSWWLPVDGTPKAPETLLTYAAIKEELKGLKTNQVDLYNLTAGISEPPRAARPGPPADREPVKREEPQGEERAKKDAAPQKAQEPAKKDADQPGRAQEETVKPPPEQKRVEAERKRLAEEKARLESEILSRVEQELTLLHTEQSRLEEERRRLLEAQARREGERQAIEQLELAKRQAEQRQLQEERRRTEEGPAHPNAERPARDKDPPAKRPAEQKRAEERKRPAQEQAQPDAQERLRAAVEQARREEAQRKRAEEQAKVIEEARVRPATPPLPAGREVLGRDGTPMVLVPAGVFTMGGDNIDNPRHPVHLDAFFMDKYEVTTARYARFLKEAGRNPPYLWNQVSPARDAERPVIGVTWDDAEAYCRWAGKRLPTEAEWEKASRGPDGRPYPWGNAAPTSRHANFNKCCEWQGYGMLTPVGSLEAGRSPYGIHDLAGNVAEWVADWYDKTYYKFELDRNPKGPAEGEEKVVRGGSWNDHGALQGSALRSRSYPFAWSTDRGFRCAKDAEK